MNSIFNRKKVIPVSWIDMILKDIHLALLQLVNVRINIRPVPKFLMAEGSVSLIWM